MTTLILNRVQSGVVVETRTLPPEPTVIPGVQQFIISLPREWIPVGLKEWDLQYSKSYDNSSFGDWIDLGTFAAVAGLGDDPRTADFESGTGGTYTHSIGEVSFPRPYYRYRYRLRTQFQQSDWSEEAYGGPATSLPNLPAPAPSVVTPSSISNNEMGANSVDSAQIITDAIIARTIRSDEIITRHIAANQIVTTHMQAGTIDANRLVAGSITTGLMSAGTINADRLVAGSITTSLMSAGTINADRLTAGSITTNLMSAGTINADRLTASTVTATQLYSGGVTANLIQTSNIAAGVITASLLASNTVTAMFADFGTMATGKLVVGNPTTNKVAIGNAISTSAGSKDGIVSTDSSNNITAWLDSATGNIQIKGTILSGSSGLGNISGQIDGSSNILNTSIPGGKLIANTITAGQIQAGTITATELQAGSISADKISLGIPYPVSLANGQFNVGNPTNGTNLTSGWTVDSGNTYTVQTDAVMGRTARVVNASTISSTTSQTVTLPVGRTVARGWVKTTGVGASGAYLSVSLGTASATISSPTILTGTNDWTFQERSIDVTTAGTVLVRMRLQDTGTAEFANCHIIATVTGTTISPTSIDTQHLVATAIDAMTITGAVFRTSSGSSRLEVNGTDGLFITSDNNVTKDLHLSSSNGLGFLVGSSSSPATPRRLQWLLSGGSAHSETFAWDDSFSHVSTLSTNAYATTSSYDARSLNTAWAGTRSATLTVAAFDGGADSDARVSANAMSAAGTYQGVMILDGGLQSSFLQLTSVSKRKINFGQVTVSVSASVSGTASGISHGLGTTPVSIVTSSDDQVYNAVADTLTSSTFRAVVRHTDSTSQTATVHVNWIAIA